MRGTLGRSDIGDEEVDAFVDRNVISFAAWDLLAYLSQNTSGSHTIADLTHLLSRADSDVEPVVARLSESGVLVPGEHRGEPTYRLTDDPAVRDVLARFVAASTRREYRLEFVRRVLGQITGA